MKILKFGGSSVGTPENIIKVIDIIIESQKINKNSIKEKMFNKIIKKVVIHTNNIKTTHRKKYKYNNNE